MKPSKLTLGVGSFLAVSAMAFGLYKTQSRMATLEAAPSPPPGRPSFKTNSEAWGRVRSPSPGAPQSYGGYSTGCISGAQTLEADGDGFHVVRLAKNRFYGHATLLNYLRTLGSESAAQGAGDLLLADLGQPRGGPMLTGHKSHQVGLDVDVWFHLLAPHTAALNKSTRENLYTDTLLNDDGKGIDMHVWNVRYENVLRLAASHPEVARIFVNPHIKKLLCRLHPETEATPWLRKLRPWWGHDDHFHVRLNCAASDVKCQAQPEIAPGNGCDPAEMNDWFNPDGTVIPPPATPPGQPSTNEIDLPDECKSVLKA